MAVDRPDQWAAVDALGLAVDAELAGLGVALTVGGEPTFVAAEGAGRPEWTVAPDGPDKRQRAERLLVELRDRLAPGAALLHGLGKWYPGEAVPRWRRLTCWRADGEPVWTRPELLAPVDLPQARTKRSPKGRDRASAEPGGPPPSAADARRFAVELAHCLGLDGSRVLPAYEDPGYHRWLEGALDPGLDLTDVERLPEGDARLLAKALERGLNAPVGSVLPLAWDGRRWRSSTWRFRQPALHLLPGTLPMGSRLPLDRLGGDGPELEVVFSADPLDRRPPLPPQGELADPSQWRAPESEEVLVRTALCVEPRGGRLFVFLPPLPLAEPWLALVAAVEEVAAALARPVALEGFDPPVDIRLRSLSVTPDPGVLEVNVHPAASWPEACATSAAVHEAARVAGLRPDRFGPEGSHLGTGGGSHVTLGGPTPAQSPFLRRPDLLVSLITFWQHHPGLSYLFAGRFVGPTSQAPRVDEARHESLDELEIAFDQLDRAGPDPAPWLVDRLLRDLLADVTGNTHRAEFCVDKLFPPDVAGSRLGLVELRAFEMPPEPAMGLLRVLLLRALVALFWRQPYRERLVRWGTRLHDQFLLEHHVAADLGDVCRVLQGAGYPFQSEWLRPQIEHRFPVIGRVRAPGVELELRHALEPWNVLGEDVGKAGASRRVDWSTERLQVRLTGDGACECSVLCNGFRVPLQVVTKARVAGVRFRARRLERSLHPTIPAVGALDFEVVEEESGRVLASCTYEPWGSSTWDRLPADAEQARALRAARFRSRGPAAAPRRRASPAGEGPEARGDPEGPGARGVPEGPEARGDPEGTDPDRPGTLDLRAVRPGDR
jgi:uncharacterized protein (DUF2126 family)